MTENDRTELFAALAELAHRYPHWRLGQLVANIAGWADIDVWDATDEQLLVAARDHLRQVKLREESASAAEDSAAIVESAF